MDIYLKSAITQFAYYKKLGEKTFAQLNDADLFWQFNAESNSIAVIIKHLSGNMLSRWTNFLITDGEKEWRNRDTEFEETINTREQIMAAWDQGWDCLFNALNSLTAEDWKKTVKIRNEPHRIEDAINRQLAHYPYHIGQIVFIGKMITGSKWQSLSIPKGNSDKYNADKFANPGDTFK
ncbi:DUF1572 domain-containing protein [Mucilaginibacter ginsenosidivorax]|uniref:DUF1572 domain-containing protein n=1 Tax=Mucilaginibacter ginsenosidivorax TaxID=862126 RepID=A0A5B8VZ58_9SPHI|nr:DUF1572 domain-containing protein [Mucilaginibacter ginsenosidivorax]QEC76950.1 DUF1572 domain-containing protein [Mucilaginibacter ginsenosidivorax]